MGPFAPFWVLSSDYGGRRQVVDATPEVVATTPPKMSTGCWMLRLWNLEMEDVSGGSGFGSHQRALDFPGRSARIPIPALVTDSSMSWSRLSLLVLALPLTDHLRPPGTP